MKADLDAAASSAGMAGIEYIEVPEGKVSLHEAVSSYLFNSQLLTPPGQPGTTIVVPTECEETAAVKNYLDELLAAENSIQAVKYCDLKQSMNNGGGPACLRLRVVLSESQISSLDAQVMLSEVLYDRLTAWVNHHYREEISPADLADPQLHRESLTALDELTGILGIGSVYDFQRS